MKAARLLMSAIALTLAATACGDDTVEPEDGLTEEEAKALFASVSTPQFDSTIIPIHFSEDSIVLPCPGGGQSKVVGDLIPVPDTTIKDTLRFVVDIVVTPRGCKLTGNEMQFTVDGDPNFHQVLDQKLFNLVEITLEGSFSGGLKWELEGRSGSCKIDLTLTSEQDLNPDAPKLTEIYSGDLCGHDVRIERVQTGEFT